MQIIRMTIAILGLVLLVSIIWAFTQKPIGESFSQIMADPWGIVAMIDLYLGFILMAAIIYMAEQNKGIAAIWIVPIFFLGNIVTALWVVLTLPKLAAALKTGKPEIEGK
jgi:hypothetical protein